MYQNISQFSSPMKQIFAQLQIETWPLRQDTVQYLQKSPTYFKLCGAVSKQQSSCIFFDLYMNQNARNVYNLLLQNKIKTPAWAFILKRSEGIHHPLRERSKLIHPKVITQRGNIAKNSTKQILKTRLWN